MKFSIMFDKDKCMGCTNCMKRCPTQAIRIKNGKAVIDITKCIHCGECIKICPYQAYSAQSVESHKEKNYKCKIAIPSATIYGQFPKGTEICKVQNAILKLGFDYVYDESWAAELVSQAIRKRLNEHRDMRPLISTNCPSAVRLIKIRYPSLMDHLISLEAPMEIAAKLAKMRARKFLKLEESDIGVFYISPCPAKMLAVTDPIGPRKSYIDWVVPLKKIYGDLYREVKKENEFCNSNPSLKGIKWAFSGGQSEAAGVMNCIAVNGMENIINIFDEVENGKLEDVDYVEALACTGGCVGGTFNIENPFIARNTIKHIIHETDENLLLNDDLDKFDEFYEEGIFNLIITEDSSAGKINMKDAIMRMDRIEQIYALLPGLDCGSCGAPTCLAHAEDIFENEATIDDCVVLRANKN